jgi:hypothetical protein
MKKFGLALFPLPPLSILESLKCLEEITWQLLPPVLTQNAKQFRTNYLAADATGIDKKS